MAAHDQHREQDHHHRHRSVDGLGESGGEGFAFHGRDAGNQTCGVDRKNPKRQTSKPENSISSGDKVAAEEPSERTESEVRRGIPNARPCAALCALLAFWFAVAGETAFLGGFARALAALEFLLAFWVWGLVISPLTSVVSGSG